ncbi:hypothetical protein Ahy_B01g056220 isoform D [Arachis hypogaea]|uniref:Uncharacterized protein n=1 Tax=Arachis hypogaea TaxID=3818 RepID=A0A445AY80_ARAHY|nr:hypothetical protein Ahy_B01g056220 isoform D [Arachis hypogaea]
MWSMGEGAVDLASMALRTWRGLSMKEDAVVHACVDEGDDDYLITENELERSHGCLRKRKKKRESQPMLFWNK